MLHSFQRQVLGVILGMSALRLAAQSPQMTLVRPPELWHRAEFRVIDVPAAANPFDPDLIRLDATFTAPSGASIVIPGFWFQDFNRSIVGGGETLMPNGKPEWRIRFIPTEPGDYKVSLAIQIKGRNAGPPVSSSFKVPAVEFPARHGFVRVAADRRYLETSDGRPLRLIGQNACWAEARGTFDYDDWFGGMKGAGENFARLWLSPWFLNIEHNPGSLNHYNLGAAWQLDYILSLAENDGIYLMLCFDHHGMFQSNNRNWGGNNNFWPTNAYNIVNGGPCASANDFFTDRNAGEFYRKRLRYLVARYGCSPNLLSWQFFNEIDNVFGILNADDVIAWHREMGRWLRAHDPYSHLISTSLTGGSERPELWSIPELDFTVYHSYGDPNPGHTIATLAASFVKRYGKPMMIGEFGIDARSWNIASDPHLRGFREALWGGALGGSVGTAMPWWWQDMHTDRAYPLFAAMNHILQIGGWQEGAWTPIAFLDETTPPDDLGAPVEGGAVFDAQLPLNLSWRWQAKAVHYLAVPDPLAAERASESLSGYLQGKKVPSLHEPIKLTAFFADKARVVLHVNSVTLDALLVVRVDGKIVFRKKIDGNEPEAGPRDINLDFAVNLPEGKHVIEISNEAADWIQLGSIRLEKVRTATYQGGWKRVPDTVGLRNGQTAILYTWSPRIAFPAGALRFNLAPVIREPLRIAGWPAGQYRARWFDPATGVEITATVGASDGSQLALTVPSFTEDLAGIIEPVR